MTEKCGCEMRDECVFYQNRERYHYFNVDPNYCDNITGEELDCTAACPIYDTAVETQLEIASEILDQVHKSSEDLLKRVNKLLAEAKKRVK